MPTVQEVKKIRAGEHLCAIEDCNEVATNVVILKMEDDGKRIGVRCCTKCLNRALQNVFGVGV